MCEDGIQIWSLAGQLNVLARLTRIAQFGKLSVKLMLQT